MPLTAAQIQALLNAAYAAQLSILGGTAQSVTVGSRSYTALNLKDLQDLITGLEAQLAALTAGGYRPGVVAFRPVGGSF